MLQVVLVVKHQMARRALRLANLVLRLDILRSQLFPICVIVFRLVNTVRVAVACTESGLPLAQI